MKTAINFNIRGLNPQLRVSNIAKSLDFYHQLGFKTAFLYDDFYAGVSKDGFAIHLKLANHDQTEVEEKIKNQDLDILLAVNDIHDVYDAVSNIDVTILQPLREMDYGSDFYIADPDGNLIAFIEEK